jgi:hypothetical protein
MSKATNKKPVKKIIKTIKKVAAKKVVPVKTKVIKKPLHHSAR